MKVVFVCLGNICRSPMAEAVFRDLVEKEGLSSKIQVDSAATSSWEHGNPVHIGTRNILDRLGLSTKDMYSRQLNETDYDADYLIGMDDDNLDQIEKFAKNHSQATIAKLLSFAGSSRNIEDPWYTGDFEQTYQDVLVGCQGLLVDIQKQIS